MAKILQKWPIFNDGVVQFDQYVHVTVITEGES
jgi:hypothetical protein